MATATTLNKMHIPLRVYLKQMDEFKAKATAIDNERRSLMEQMQNTNDNDEWQLLSNRSYELKRIKLRVQQKMTKLAQLKMEGMVYEEAQEA